MGADPLKKDIFLQIDWMHGTGGGGGTDGFGTHDHKPKLAALDNMRKTIDSLSTEVAKAQVYVERARTAEIAQANADTLANELSLPSGAKGA